MPIIGWFFKSVSKENTVTETVIFIKATIVKSSSQVDKVDRDIQEKFDTNRREFFSTQ
jgi:type II secretory pathway component GspD/PulD (secretin)